MNIKKLQRRSLLKKLLGFQLVMNVFAEESEEALSNGTEISEEGEQTLNPEGETPKPSGILNYEDLIAQARKEEKEKLYPQIEKLKKDKNDLLILVAEKDKAIKDLEKEISQLQKNHSKLAKDVEDSATTNKVVQEQTLIIAQLEQQLEELQAQHELETNTIKISALRKELIAESKGSIIPEMVVGNTEEEIIASVELAKQRFAEIQEQAMSNIQMPRSVNPSVVSLAQNSMKSVEEMAQMTPAEWAEYRKHLNIK